MTDALGSFNGDFSNAVGLLRSSECESGWGYQHEGSVIRCVPVGAGDLNFLKILTPAQEQPQQPADQTSISDYIPPAIQDWIPKAFQDDKKSVVVLIIAVILAYILLRR